MFTYGDKVETTTEYQELVDKFNTNSTVKLDPYVKGRISGISLEKDKIIYAVGEWAINGKYLRTVEE